MKTFIIAALALGFATQAMAGSATTKASPGVEPGMASKYVPEYTIVAAKVAQGVKFQNPAVAKGLNNQPLAPSKGMLPSRTE